LRTEIREYCAKVKRPGMPEDSKLRSIEFFGQEGIRQFRDISKEA
jgi:hypothetical protein